MREIMANTKEGKDIIKEIVEDVKVGLQEDEFNEAMTEVAGTQEDVNTSSDNQTFNFDELLGDGDSEDNTEEDGFNFEELF